METRELVELSKEELNLIISGIDCISDGEYYQECRELLKKLEPIFYKLKWKNK